MKKMLSSIDYVVECRDSRAPVTSINPMFEEALGKTRRLIVYTKRDLSSIPQSPIQKLVSRVAWTIEFAIRTDPTMYRQRKNSEPSIPIAQCSL